MANAVKVNVFLTDMGNFAAMNEIYEKAFPDPKPVSSHCVSSLQRRSDADITRGSNLCLRQGIASRDGCRD